MKALALLLSLWAGAAACADWVIVPIEPRVAAGARFEVVVVPPPGQQAPDELIVQMGIDIAELAITMGATGPMQDGRRAYAATMPNAASGPVNLRLAEFPSNVSVVVARRSDAIEGLAGGFGAGEHEPLLSENEPMYFIIGSRGGWSARFQISLKYRLFDAAAGLGQERPWLSGLYLGYTQNSIWDLSTESKAFRDTSYRPSLFWKWERARGAKAFFDGARVGFEHESNGGDADTSRSINIFFMRPQWRWQLPRGGTLEFMPKLYAYLEKEDNSDIDDYRGYADWQVRYESGVNWIASTMLRHGTAGKSSVLIDVSRRVRDLKFGPVSGYFHVQFFAGYGESILEYNVQRKSQLRVGFAIVP